MAFHRHIVRRLTPISLRAACSAQRQTSFVAGAFSRATLDARGVDVSSAAILIDDQRRRHLTRSAKRDWGQGLTDADIADLPRLLREPEAVLWDTEDPAIVYAFRSLSAGDRRGKVVVRVAPGRAHHADKVLTESGDLGRCITVRATRDSVEIGSTRIYAGTHQFGARRGQYGADRAGRPIPWGDIPARPFRRT